MIIIIAHKCNIRYPQKQKATKKKRVEYCIFVSSFTNFFKRKKADKLLVETLYHYQPEA